MKTCSKCKKLLGYEHFYPNKTKKDGYQYSCIECISAYKKLNYEKTKQKQKNRVATNKTIHKKWFKSIKDNLCCQNCGFSNPLALDFHHRDKKQKYKEVSKLVCDGYSKKVILSEIEKCDILCANCHRILHGNDT